MLIILDRDGVINTVNEDEYVRHVRDWHPIDGSLEAIARLWQSGYKIALATNQSGVGRGYFSQEILLEIHNKMINLVKDQGGDISYIAICPHHPDEGCDCRKPEPGLLQKIAKELNIPDFSNTYMVGDSLKDLQAAASVGSNPILVKTGNGMKTLEEIKHTSLAHTPVFNRLSDFVDSLLGPAS